MKKILSITAFLLAISSINNLIAQDDVYDAPKPKQVKVKPTYSAPAEQTEKIIPVEKTQPYTEEGNSSSRMQSTSNNNNYTRNDNDYSDDFSSNFGYGYSDRIRRFHNNSFQFINTETGHSEYVWSLYFTRVLKIFFLINSNYDAEDQLYEYNV